MPVRVAPVLCGVMVSLLPDTQYEYIELSWAIVIALAAVV
jgi:hypothetical protein